jgi:uncharacterized protein
VITNNTELHRFELGENGMQVVANYRQHDKTYVITHVEADDGLRGTGAAGRLMTDLVAEAREKNFLIVPRCSYAVAWFKRHPHAADVLE